MIDFQLQIDQWLGTTEGRIPGRGIITVWYLQVCCIYTASILTTHAYAIETFQYRPAMDDSC